MFTKSRDSAPKSTFPKPEWKYTYHRPFSSQVSNNQKQKNIQDRSPLNKKTYDSVAYATSRSFTKTHEFNPTINPRNDLEVIQDLVKGLQLIQRKSDAVETEYKEKLDVANLLNQHLKTQLEQVEEKNFKMSQEIEQLRKEKQELKEMLREAQEFIFSNQLTDLHKQFSSQCASQKIL